MNFSEMKDLPLGEALVHAGIISQEVCDAAVKYMVSMRQKGNTEYRIGDALTDLDYMVRSELEDFVRHLHGPASKRVRTYKSEEPHEFISMSSSDAAPVRYLNSLLRKAARMGVSDIHFEDTKHGCLIRFRENGELVIKDLVSSSFSKEFDGKIRSKSRLSLTERNIPLDSKFSYQVDGRDVDVRVSFLPLSDGKQSIVFRLLDSKANMSTFEDIEMPDDVRHAITHVISQPLGLFIITGPTGSGKTTTLYSLIKKLNKPEVKIITAEDPIEYQIDGIIQSQVSGKTTFAKALKSMLRQDPDVILVGEIRDSDTARIAVQASLTGHLVFSTLHANSAILTLDRLLDLNVNPNALGSGLGGFMAQRLVRKLCEHCKIEKPMDQYDANELIKAGISEDVVKSMTHTYQPNHCGCGKCSKGWKGRVPIFEVIINSKEIRAAIEAKDIHAFARAAEKQKHYASLSRAAMNVVLNGKTSVLEAMAVAGYTFDEFEGVSLPLEPDSTQPT